MQNFKSISVEALGLLTTSELSSDVIGAAPVSNVRYPVIYEPTEEALLVSGSLVQLGDETVQLTPSELIELDQVETCVFKLLFRIFARALAKDH